jgi:hypothetical protein
MMQSRGRPPAASLRAEEDGLLDPMAVLGLGLLLGVRHALDADHVVAVSIIVSRERSARRAAWLGAAWAVGHTLTVGAVGAAIVLFGFVVSPRLGLSLELAVAAMLIGLGAWNLRALLRSGTPHSHGDFVHSHPHHGTAHGHGDSAMPLARLDRAGAASRLYRLLRPLAVGMVHGLAGSAALALFILPVLPSPSWALAYLGVFGAGTMLGMMAVTGALALPFSFARGRFAWLNRALAATASVAGIGFGLGLAGWLLAGA